MIVNIHENIPLYKYTTFKIGGPARYFCEVKNLNEFKDALYFSEKNRLPILILGGGSNVLVSDKGFEGLVIKLVGSKLSTDNLSIEADAGVSLGRIVVDSVNNGLNGMEWAAGVPGTLGGAIRGNAGCFGGEMKDIIENVTIFDLDKMKERIISKKECGFGYRDSMFKKNKNLIIWSASLLLKKGDINEMKEKIRYIMEYRKDRQHLELPSAGSIFKNISDNNAIKKIAIKAPDAIENARSFNGAISVAYLFDKCGLNGLKVGGAMISPKQPNFIVNCGNAKAEDVIILIGIIKERIMVKFGILLETEIQLVGF